MAWEYIVLRNEENSLTTRFIRAYVRDTAVSPQVKLVEAIIPHSAPLSSLDLAALWAGGTIIPGGAKLWNQYELKDTDENTRDVVNAIFDVVRANGTLTQALTAGTAALVDLPKQQTAYNRLVSMLQAGTAAERNQFMALVAVIALSKAGQR